MKHFLRRRWIDAVGWIAFAISVMACQSEQTVVLVDLTAKDGVVNGKALHVLVEIGNDARELDLPPLVDEPLFLPEGSRTTAFAILANGRSGNMNISVELVDADDRALAEGSAKIAIRPFEETHVPLTLYPNEMVLNTKSLLVSPNTTFGPSGRQLGVDREGRFVALWTPEPCTDACTPWLRFFDAHGLARGATGSAAEIALTTASLGKNGMVASSSGGKTFVAWERLSDTSTEIVMSLFDEQGKSMSSEEGVRLDDDSGAQRRLSDLKIVDDNAEQALVIWEELTTETVKVLGRTIDASRNAASNSLLLVEDVGTTPPTPRVAAASSEQWMLLWKHATDGLVARIFKRDGTPHSNQIVLSATASSNAFDVMGLAYGYAVIWIDEQKQVLFQRFSQGGVPLEQSYVISGANEVEFSSPTIGKLNDGTLLVSWHSKGPLDPDGGIMGQIILPDGLPLGSPFRINGPMEGLQSAPSITSRGNRDGFTTLFTSVANPETNASSATMRGRLIYPDLEPRNGAIGAVCSDDDPCKPGFFCREGTPSRCVPRCDNAIPCGLGGVCKPYQGTKPLVCYYLTAPN